MSPSPPLREGEGKKDQDEIPEKTGMEPQLDAGSFPPGRAWQVLSPPDKVPGRVTVPSCINSHQGSGRIVRRTEH